MKKMLMTVAAMAAMVGFAGQDDLLVTISSESQLCYGNETPVNNEIVALVWTPSGATFGGFYANGSVVDGVSRVLVRMKVADGKFPTTTFVIDAKLASDLKLTSGTFALYLLDTRAADGVAQGVVTTSDNQRIVPVNYVAKIVEGGASGSSGSSIVSIDSEDDSPVFASGEAKLPFEWAELQPIIKSAKVEDGKFKVTIEKAVPYLKYGLLAGSTPDTVTTPVGEDVTPKTETLELWMSADEPAGFIRVNAGRNQTVE